MEVGRSAFVLAYCVDRSIAAAAGRVFTPGLRLDDVENRWRRLEVLERRERRCSLRCSTVWACEASAAVYRLTLLTSLAVGRP